MKDRKCYGTAATLSKPGRVKNITSYEENAIFPFSLALMWSLVNLPQFPQPPCLLGPFQQLTGAARGVTDLLQRFFSPTQSLFHESAQFLGMHVCGLQSPDGNYFCTKYCNSVCKEMKISPKEGLGRG